MLVAIPIRDFKITTLISVLLYSKKIWLLAKTQTQQEGLLTSIICKISYFAGSLES